MTSNRREFIAGVGVSLAVLPALHARARRLSPLRAFKQLLAEIAEELLADYPENATSLGIDTGPRARA